MEKCDYGCDQEARYIFKNGKRCCSEFYRSCPYQAKQIGKLRLGKKHTEETKKKIGLKSKKRIQDQGGPPFKGRKHTEEAKKKIGNAIKGNVGWNKGLTKETNTSVYITSLKNKDGRTANYGPKNGMYGKTHTKEIKEKQSQKNIEERKWQGENNPKYGSNMSGENSPRFLPNKERTKWEKYKNTVRMLTERTYKKFKNDINPTDQPRGIKQYHLDHIIPIWYGFINKINPILLSKKENLRMLYWKNNVQRNKVHLSESEILILNLLQQV